ncbi:hypothetical protein FRC01_008421 [Tulasnella sp. 417]|nr:hypothetical protein FRC01_008421 [Tulasnella sp. 417]
MTEPTTPAFVPHPPFDSESTGDCIIQASDGAKFHVYRAVLCMGSVVFRDMFDMPPAPSSTTEESNQALPVIPVQEDAETLQALLQLMHPIDPPSITSLHLAQKLVTACEKYFISMAKLRIYLRSILTEYEVLKKEPLTCYAIAWKLGLVNEAIIASRYTHFIDLTEISVAKALFSCSGGLEAMLALFRMRSAREDALEGLLSLVKPGPYVGCKSSLHGGSTIIVSDYTGRRAQLKESLKAPYPACESPESLLGFQVIPGGRECSSCAEGVKIQLRAIKTIVIEALARYPQTISRFVTLIL